MSLSKFNSLSKKSNQIYTVKLINSLPTGTAFSSNTLTSNGCTYTASSSSNDGNLAYKAFNGNAINTNFWSSAYLNNNLYTQYPYSSGVYQGGGTGYYHTTISIDGESIAGEWLQIQLSIPAKLKSYGILNRSGNGDARNPTNYAILGSNDGSTWVKINRQTAKTTSDTPSTYKITVDNLSYYLYYRLVINAIGNVTAPCNLARFDLTFW